jgi:hypothetical protein
VAVVFMGEVSAVAVSAAVAFVVAALVAVSVQCVVDTCSATAELLGGGATTGVAMGAITDSIMSSFSTTPAFRGGGVGTIRTDTTRTAITRTITMDTADTVTTVALGTVITMAPAMDIARAAEPVMDTATMADQGISEVCEGGDKGAPRRLAFISLLVGLDTLTTAFENCPLNFLPRDFAMPQVFGSEALNSSYVFHSKRPAQKI